jgi:hypothetical protein
VGSQDTISFNTNDTGVTIELDVDGFGGTSSFVVSEGGPDHADTNGQTINLLEPAGTVINYDGSQAQQQATTLKQLCAVDADATCTFTPTSETTVDGPQHQVGDAFTNASSLEAHYTLAEKDTVGISDSVEISASVGAKLFDLVDTSITATYSHGWITSHEYEPVHDGRCAAEDQGLARRRPTDDPRHRQLHHHHRQHHDQPHRRLLRQPRPHVQRQLDPDEPIHQRRPDPPHRPALTNNQYGDVYS